MSGQGFRATERDDCKKRPACAQPLLNGPAPVAAENYHLDSLAAHHISPHHHRNGGAITMFSCKRLLAQLRGP